MSGWQQKKIRLSAGPGRQIDRLIRPRAMALRAMGLRAMALRAMALRTMGLRAMGLRAMRPATVRARAFEAQLPAYFSIFY
jgi:hypothetical protein